MINSESPRLSFLHLSFALLLTGFLWMLVQLFAYVDWGKGRERAILLVAVIASCTILIIDHRRSLKYAQGLNVSEMPPAWWITTLLMIALLITSYIISEPAQTLKLEAIAICLIILGPLAASFFGVRIELIVRHLPTYIIAFLIVSLLGRLASFFYYSNTTYLIDIAQTTLKAVHLLLQGRNPYTIPIDWNPAYPDYRGYKYLPVMIVTYLPFASSFGATGMRLTNLVLDVITAVLIGILARRQSGGLCGILVASLYVMLPMLPRDLYMNAVTDLAPTVFLLAAMAVYETRPGLAGGMVGLSVSAKLFPGLLMLVCCFPELGRCRYVGGFLIGLIPAIAFCLLAPSDFMHNVVWFTATRPNDTTSWLYGAPSYIIGAARLAFVLFIVAVSFAVIWRSPDFFERCALYVLCTTAALLAGPTIHNNYMLWWIPFFCLLLGSPLSRILSLPRSLPNTTTSGTERGGKILPAPPHS